MSQLISFFLPGEPVPKGRHRTAIQGNRVRTYTPKPTADYERYVKTACQIAMIEQKVKPIKGPVWLNLLFTMPVPASWSKAKRHDAVCGRIRHVSKPDLSNLLKAVEDGLNGVAYKDDAAIGHMYVSKVYGREPGVLIQVGAWEYVDAVKAGAKP